MAYCRRPVRAEAWQIPLLGHAAKEVAPPWVIDRMKIGEIYVNAFGGLSYQDTKGNRNMYSLPGDYIVLTEFDRVEFYSPSDFPRYHHPE